MSDAQRLIKEPPQVVIADILAGQGHETCQEIGGSRLPSFDQVQTQTVLSEWRVSA